MSSLSEKNFERIIDCLEKIAFQYKDTQAEKVESWFFQHAEETLKKAVKLNQLQHIINKYWKKTRNEHKWQVFIRKFWENPDYNETDISLAYRKRDL